MADEGTVLEDLREEPRRDGDLGRSLGPGRMSRQVKRYARSRDDPTAPIRGRGKVGRRPRVSIRPAAIEHLPQLVVELSLVPGNIALLMYLANVRNNPCLTGTRRLRWLLLIALFPYSLIAYWAKHGRTHRRDPDATAS